MRQAAADCIAELTSLLVDETSRLARGERGGVADLIVRKQQVSSAFRAFAADGSFRAMPDLKGALETLCREIDANRSALEHALRVQRVMLRILADATRRAAPIQSYGRSGSAVLRQSAGLLGRRRI